MADAAASIHASAVLIAHRSFGARAVLIRGPSGAGKSRLALALIGAAQRGDLLQARLVADDRAVLEAHGGRVLVRPAAELAGLLEVRGLGIRRLPHEPLAAVGLVVDLGHAAERLPETNAQTVTLHGVNLPRLMVAQGLDSLPMLLAYLGTAESGI